MFHLHYFLLNFPDYRHNVSKQWFLFLYIYIISILLFILSDKNYFICARTTSTQHLILFATVSDNAIIVIIGADKLCANGVCKTYSIVDAAFSLILFHFVFLSFFFVANSHELLALTKQVDRIFPIEKSFKFLFLFS